jgi:iron complex outermembrane receptor protein
MGRSKLKFLLFTILLLQGAQILAQKGMTDTTASLPVLEISGHRQDDFSSAYNVRSIDSIRMMQMQGADLSSILSDNGLVYIKKYGTNGLGSISVRGTSAVHTATVWNGFSLQSPMNGGNDLSLFPAGFSDRIALQSGGACALFGSGAIGGSLQLSNDPAFGSGLRISAGLQAGSFSNYGGKLSVDAGTAKTSVYLRGFYKNGLNNFPYYYNHQGPFKMQHSALEAGGLIGGVHLALTKNQFISIHGWWQQNKRELGQVISTIQDEVQNDRVFRTSAEWRIIKKAYSISARNLFASENQHYSTIIRGIDSENNFIDNVTEVEIKITAVANHLFNLGFNNAFEQVNSVNYKSVEQRDRPSLFFNHRYQTRNGRLNTTVSLREEYADKFILPVFTGGLEWKAFKGFALHWAGSRVYRIPTMNDLYWSPGGNTELSPEEGWTAECGINQEIKYRKWSFNAGITGYSYNIKNWIQWLPSGAYWTPKNVQQVWSRGLESEIKCSYLLKKWSFVLSGEYSYTLSSNMISKFTGDASVGKQLIYTPEHQAGGRIHIGFSGFLLSYYHKYTGIRYISGDNLDYLPGFHTGDLILSKNFRLKKSSLNISASCENLWNSRYLVIAAMPMPGRSYSLSINYQFHNPETGVKHKS